MGAGKIESGTPGRISEAGGRLMRQTGPSRKLIFKQMEEALRTGGVDAKIPGIQRAVATARQAQAGGLRQTAEQLTQRNVGGPFASRILAGQRLAGQQQLASIPTQMAEQVIGQGMPLLGSTQSLGMGAFSQGIQLGQAARMFNAQQFMRSVPFMQTGQQGLIGGICLHPNTHIETPNGEIVVCDMEVGDEVLTLDADGKTKIPAEVIATMARRVSPQHQFLEIATNDGPFYVSGPHPLADGSPIEHRYVTAPRVRAVSLGILETCDVKVSGPTGVYFVGGIALGSTIGDV